MTTQNCVTVTEDLTVWTVTLENCDTWTITVTDEDFTDGSRLDFRFEENSGHIVTIGL